ncbi:hypothetical protein BKA67DRAFT_661954 [Truncatella angustata]|uniref:Uncharacterized protein n=1 Tax=Truncatella angustata TaxID=152316 RepID=A0A9P8ZVL8_9PEZI|nr:uncharacterized protein BKA67DRAFT_661954 [Truncatella angustata]KAH6649028.1 hypothetical protein BKA67DRAFT_661954 [Truncatella angustata]KAH8201778.1 hypothetical protein TruAng_004042 [Truncatella angustata]
MLFTTTTVMENTLRSHYQARFPLFQLPRELREKIYVSHMEDEQALRYLGAMSPGTMRLEIPTLFHVSSKVRREAIPVFFQQCHFAVYVNSNVEDVFWAWKMKSRDYGNSDMLLWKWLVNSFYHELTGSAIAQSGIPHVAPDLVLWLGSQDIQPHAFIRNIKIDFWPCLTNNARSYGWSAICTCGHRVTFKHSNVYGIIGEPVLEEDFTATRKLVEDVATEIVQRDNFKGFTIQDVTELAKPYHRGL